MSKPAQKPKAPDFEDIDTAPKDRRPIEVTEDGDSFTAAYWRETSRMNFKTRRWERTGFWAVFGTQNERLSFEPLGWRPMQLLAPEEKPAA